MYFSTLSTVAKAVRIANSSQAMRCREILCQGQLILPQPLSHTDYQRMQQVQLIMDVHGHAYRRGNCTHVRVQ